MDIQGVQYIHLPFPVHLLEPIGASKINFLDLFFVMQLRTPIKAFLIVKFNVMNQNRYIQSNYARVSFTYLP